MGRKGPDKHLKRHQSPMFWPIERKAGVWATKPKPGPHSQGNAMPLNVLIRDELKYAKTARESKYLVKQGKILVDGKPRVDHRFPIGLMDVVTIPDTDEHFRVLPDHNGKLRLQPVSVEEAKFKLARITGKKTLQGRRTQLNLHDGQNLIISAEADSYKVNDVVKLKVPEKEILEHIEFKEMQHIVITGGRSQGAQGMIIGLGPEPGWKKTCTIRTPQGEDIRTLLGYVFVVGSKQPVITLNAGEGQ
ncbi:30S ribosomal protein S4e [Candidatus Bathyarchaeota archaeon RBG_16_57_9]|nr:MAG: 30S ribosomal protein S4e [Candidatus Bathyarchaeota archaeon RBG_16_57_9]OGD54101.1 MAG: 30S ribosomal protein S4e [Candidatus Bathyarchaeota archaeon RBG_13_60_20]